jgi:hypothetical protein
VFHKTTSKPLYWTKEYSHLHRGYEWRCIRVYREVCYMLTETTLKKNGGFRDVTPCGYCKNRRLGGI